MPEDLREDSCSSRLVSGGNCKQQSSQHRRRVIGESLYHSYLAQRIETQLRQIANVRLHGEVLVHHDTHNSVHGGWLDNGSADDKRTVIEITK